MRYRIFYAKRHEACFVPHIVMPTVFSRSAARCGIKFCLTEGFTKRAKLSFAPELPVGVVALNEPLDVWLENLDDELFEAWKNSMPAGFILKSYEKLPDDAKSIGKCYPISRCLIKTRAGYEKLADFLSKDERIISCDKLEENFFEITFENKNSFGVLVRTLVAENIIENWSEVCLVRKNLEG